MNVGPYQMFIIYQSPRVHTFTYPKHNVEMANGSNNSQLTCKVVVQGVWIGWRKHREWVYCLSICTPTDRCFWLQLYFLELEQPSWRVEKVSTSSFRTGDIIPSQIQKCRNGIYSSWAWIVPFILVRNVTIFGNEESDVYKIIQCWIEVI